MFPQIFDGNMIGGEILNGDDESLLLLELLKDEKETLREWPRFEQEREQLKLNCTELHGIENFRVHSNLTYDV